MKLPRAQAAVVADDKLTRYLLSMAHPQGHAKAEFFRSFGFSVEFPLRLAEALRRHVAEHNIAAMEDTPFGRRYIVEGPMAGRR